MRIELDRAHLVRDRRGVAAVEPLAAPDGVGLQRFQRRRRHLVEAGRETLERRKRFAQLRAQAHRGAVERLQHLALAVRAGLFGDERVAGIAVERREADHVVVAEREDRSGDGGPGARALADLERHFADDGRVLRALHDLERRVHLAIGQDLEERRLREVQQQRLPEGPVEDRVARLVLDVAQEDDVAFGDARRRRELEPRCDLRLTPHAHGCREAIAAPRHRGDRPFTPERGVEDLSQRRDVVGEGAFLDHDAGPHAIEEQFLCHDTPGLLHQHHQDLGRLGREGDELVAPIECAPSGVEPERAEFVVGQGHRGRLTPSSCRTPGSKPDPSSKIS